jgi:hypothetical protein
MNGYPVRVRLGLILIMVFALLSSVHLLRRAIQPGLVPVDDIGRYEARFERLKLRLPPRGLVGYVSDPRPEATGPDGDADLAYFRRFLLAQYALAPAILLHRRPADDPDAPFAVFSRIAGDSPPDIPQPGFVIGNFHALGLSEIRALPGLILQEDFGDGVVLLRRNPQ